MSQWLMIYIYSLTKVVLLITTAWNVAKCSSTTRSDDILLEELIQEGELPPSGSSKGSSSSGSRPTRETSRTPVAAKKKQQPKKGQGTKVVKTKPPPRPPQTPHRTRDNEPAFDPFQQKVDQRITRMTPMGKLERIARGEKKDKDAYPTLGDVQSDWDDDAKEKLKPKQPELNDKQKIIAMGAKRDQNAYPTMDDIPSDWDSKEEEEKGRVEIGPKKKRGGKIVVRGGRKRGK